MVYLSHHRNPNDSAQRTNRRGLVSALVGTLAVVLLAAPSIAGAQQHHARLSRDLVQRLTNGDGTDTRVIVTGSRQRIEALAERHGLRVRKWLLTGAAVDVPAGFLARVADDSDVDQLSGDSPVQAHMAVTNVAIGADQLHQAEWAPGMAALTGQGIGVAVIDSGVSNVPELRGRISVTVDFTGTGGSGQDENGHGTHVAGIIAGGALNKNEQTVGVAPAASIVSLRVLDAHGRGFASDVIDAIDWAVANRERFSIRVINLSLGAPVLQSWRDDPLDQAVERAYEAGIVVVAAAGNFGKDSEGHAVRGGITAPGNSPYAITVGAVNTMGTPWRSDDQVASYSSRGPTAIDGLIKPDLVAPGNKIESLLAPNALLAKEHPELVVGSGPNARLQLSGTSMAAAVVSGAAALLRERGFDQPLVREMLQLSAQPMSSGLLGSGAGSLNALAAAMGMDHRTIIANEAVGTSGLAFTGESVREETVVWGASQTLVWGGTVVWGEKVVWGESGTVVWGESGTVVWGESGTVVWGESDTVVWGEADTVVWGETNTVVWGESGTVVWGEAETVVWGE